MDDVTKNRLLGLNNLLLDLFRREIFISHILKESGFNENQITAIRSKHLNEYLRIVVNKIYYNISTKYPERYAKIIKLCYYFDGKQADSNHTAENIKLLERQIYKLQFEAIKSLNTKYWLDLFKWILISSARQILKNSGTPLVINARVGPLKNSGSKSIKEPSKL